MSVKVDLAEIAEHVRGRGAGFLITTGDDGRPHTTQVIFELVGDTLRAPAGRKTCRNIGAQPLVALLWPPASAGDYNLIIDGTAQVVDLDDDGKGWASIEATHAILHRNAEGGGNDCAPVT
jgi:Pyridoxamine 5'-phosphate oxidase